MDLEIAASNGLPRITLLGEPGKQFQGNADCGLQNVRVNWILLITNAPVNSRFEFLDTNAAALDHRFYRGLKP